MKLVKVTQKQEMVPVVQPVQEEKKDCLFFDEDLSLDKTIGFVHVDDKFVVTNREDISDKIYNQVNILKQQAANGGFKGEDVHKNYYALTNSAFIRNRVNTEIKQLLYSVIEAKITIFINSILKEDKKISTKDIIHSEDYSYYGYNDIERSGDSALSLRTSLLNIMSSTNNTIQKRVLDIVYNIKVSDLNEGCNIFINEKANENINDFIFMMVSEKVVEAMHIFGDGLNLILLSRAAELNSDKELNEKIEIIRSENSPKRKLGQCHECEY